MLDRGVSALASGPPNADEAANPCISAAAHPGRLEAAAALADNRAAMADLVTDGLSNLQIAERLVSS